MVVQAFLEAIADEFERRIIMKLVTCCVAVGSVVAVGIVVYDKYHDRCDES